MIELHANQWHVRWFLCSLHVWDEFRNKDTYLRNDTTNLCYFMRVTLLYAPFVVLCHLLPVALLFLALYTAAISFSVLVYAQIFFTVVVFIALAKGLHAGRSMATEYLEGYTAYPSSMALDNTSVQWGGPSFVELFFEYVRSMKEKVCPMIRIHGVEV
jgi:hypothetical protein